MRALKRLAALPQEAGVEIPQQHKQPNEPLRSRLKKESLKFLRVHSTSQKTSQSQNVSQLPLLQSPFLVSDGLSSSTSMHSPGVARTINVAPPESRGVLRFLFGPVKFGSHSVKE